MRDPGPMESVPPTDPLPSTGSLLTFRGLGDYGRLGNQLFQIAATVGLARSLGLDVRFDAWARRDEFRLPDSLFGSVPDHAVDARDMAAHLPHPHRHYLQEYALFGAALPSVRAWLTPSEAIVDEARRKLGELLERPCPTAVHVRRTDYVEHDDLHPPQPPVYYEEALARLPRTATPIVFTDDPGWCRSELAHLRPAAVVEPGPDVVDLAGMALCERHVIANSSYSYWGAILSGDRFAVYPLQWFGPGFVEAASIQRTPRTWIGVDPYQKRTVGGLRWSQRRWRRQLARRRRRRGVRPRPVDPMT